MNPWEEDWSSVALDEPEAQATTMPWEEDWSASSLMNTEEEEKLKKTQEQPETYQPPVDIESALATTEPPVSLETKPKPEKKFYRKDETGEYQRTQDIGSLEFMWDDIKQAPFEIAKNIGTVFQLGGNVFKSDEGIAYREQRNKKKPGTFTAAQTYVGGAITESIDKVASIAEKLGTTATDYYRDKSEEIQQVSAVYPHIWENPAQLVDPKYIASTLIPTFRDMGVAYAAASLTGGIAAPLVFGTVMGAETALPNYEENIRKGMDPTLAGQAFATQFVVTSVLNSSFVAKSLGLGDDAFKGVATRKGIAGNVLSRLEAGAHAGLREMPVEYLDEVTQNTTNLVATKMDEGKDLKTVAQETSKELPSIFLNALDVIPAAGVSAGGIATAAYRPRTKDDPETSKENRQTEAAIDKVLEEAGIPGKQENSYQNSMSLSGSQVFGITPTYTSTNVPFGLDLPETPKPEPKASGAEVAFGQVGISQGDLSGGAAVFTEGGGLRVSNQGTVQEVAESATVSTPATPETTPATQVSEASPETPVASPVPIETPAATPVAVPQEIQATPPTGAGIPTPSETPSNPAIPSTPVSPETKINIILGEDRVINEEETIAKLPKVPDGHVRLYRASSPTVKFSDVFKPERLTKFYDGKKGEFYTDSLKYADYFRETYGKDASISYIDVPTNIAESGKTKSPSEYILDLKPAETTEKSSVLSFKAKPAASLSKEQRVAQETVAKESEVAKAFIEGDIDSLYATVDSLYKQRISSYNKLDATGKSRVKKPSKRDIYDELIQEAESERIAAGYNENFKVVAEEIAEEVLGNEAPSATKREKRGKLVWSTKEDGVDTASDGTSVYYITKNTKPDGTNDKGYILWKGKQNVGVFGSKRAAKMSLVPETKFEIKRDEGKSDYFRVVSTATGQAVMPTGFKKKWMAEEFLRRLEADPKMNKSQAAKEIRELKSKPSTGAKVSGKVLVPKTVKAEPVIDTEKEAKDAEAKKQAEIRKQEEAKAKEAGTQVSEEEKKLIAERHAYNTKRAKIQKEVDEQKRSPKDLLPSWEEKQKKAKGTKTDLEQRQEAEKRVNEAREAKAKEKKEAQAEKRAEEEPDSEKTITPEQTKGIKSIAEDRLENPQRAKTKNKIIPVTKGIRTRSVKIIEVLQKVLGLSDWTIVVADINQFRDMQSNKAASEDIGFNENLDNDVILFLISEGKDYAIDKDRSTNGSIYSFVENKQLILSIDESKFAGIKGSVRAMGIIAHELGHAVANRILANMSAVDRNQILDKMIDDYSDYYAKTFESHMRLGETLLISRSAASRVQLRNHIEETILGNTSKDIPIDTMSTPSTKAYVSYLTSFNEWFADQVAKYVEHDVAVVSKFDQFMKGFADTVLKAIKILNEFAGFDVIPMSKPAESVANFIKDIGSVAYGSDKGQFDKSWNENRKWLLRQQLDGRQRAAKLAATSSFSNNLSDHKAYVEGVSQYVRGKKPKGMATPDSDTGVPTDPFYDDDNALLDEKGNPPFVFHGSPEILNGAIDTSIGNKMNYLGAGFNVTSSAEDASLNYSGNGTGMLYSYIIKMAKPFYVNDSDRAVPMLSKDIDAFINGIQKESKKYPKEVRDRFEEIISSLQESSDINEPVDSTDIWSMFQENLGQDFGIYVRDNEGDRTSAGYILNNVLRDIGYDGIVLNAGAEMGFSAGGDSIFTATGMSGITEDTVHYLMFNSSDLVDITQGVDSESSLPGIPDSSKELANENIVTFSGLGGSIETSAKVSFDSVSGDNSATTKIPGETRLQRRKRERLEAAGGNAGLVSAQTGLIMETVDEAKATFAQSRSFSAKQRRMAERVLNNIKDIVKTNLESAADRLEQISPSLMRKVNKYVMYVNTKNADHKKRVSPFIGFVSKQMSSEDADLFGLYLSNGKETDWKQVEKMFAKYPGLEKHWKAAEAVLIEIRKAAEEVGLSMENLVDNYFPRKVNDVDGLRRYLYGDDSVGKINDEIRRAKVYAEKHSIPFTDKDEADIINQMISTGRYYGHLQKPGALKERNIQRVNSVMLSQFYSHPMEALTAHIYEMNEAIGQRVVIGHKLRKAKMAELVRQEKKLEKSEEGSKERKRLIEKVKGLRNYLFDVDNKNELNDSISNFIQAEISSGSLKGKDADEVLTILRARMMEKGIYGWTNTLRNVGLISTLADFTSLITQSSEVVFSMYRNGMLRSLAALVQTKEITAEMFDLRSAQYEWQQEGSAKWVSKILKLTGFSAADIFMKESAMQATLGKWRAVARKGDAKSLTKFRKHWSPYFGEDVETLLVDLQSNEVTDTIKEMAWADLLKYQPLDVIANPIGYMTGGRTRIFWMLKTFQLRAVNALYRESVREMQKGNVAKGIKNLMYLTFLMVMGGAGKDELRDLWLGRKTGLSDQLSNNLWNIFLMSNYEISNIGKSGHGPMWSIASKILPPDTIVDTIVMDVVKTAQGKPTYNTIKHFPVLGKVFHSRFTEAGRTKESTRQKSQFLAELRDNVSNPRELRRIRNQILEYNRERLVSGDRENIISTTSISRVINDEKKKRKE